MATTLIENLWKISECGVIFDKQIRQTLHVALFNLCHVFYIVVVKRIKWCIVLHTIVQMGLPVGVACIQSGVYSESQVATASSAGDHLRNVCLLLRCLCHDHLDTTCITHTNQQFDGETKYKTGMYER